MNGKRVTNQSYYSFFVVFSTSLTHTLPLIHFFITLFALSKQIKLHQPQKNRMPPHKTLLSGQKVLSHKHKFIFI